MKSERAPQVHIGEDSNGKKDHPNRKAIPDVMSWDEYEANCDHNKKIRGKIYDNWMPWNKKNS
jgi:hypothetical protein